MKKNGRHIRRRKKETIFVLCIFISFLIPSMLYGTSSWISFSQEGNEGASPQIIAPQSSGTQTVVDIKVPGMWRSQVTTHGHTFDILNIPDCATTGEPGKAQLPIVGKLVAIPPTSEVSLTVVSAYYTVLKGYYVYPFQVRFLGDSDTTWYYDDEFYNQDAFYPSVVAKISEPGIWRDCRVVQLTACPVAFNPITGELRVYDHIVLRLDYCGTSNKNRLDWTRSTISPEQARMYRDLILNFDYLSYEESDSIHKRYLIITDQYFDPCLEELREWKQRKGVNTETGYLDTDVPRDAVSIRDYIKSFFTQHVSDDIYVLLVGDPDTSLTDSHYLPMYQWYTDTPPYVWSDHYYSCVNGDDLYPDIQVGRISPA